MLAANGQAKDIELKSAWPQAPVKTDGTAEQWGGHLQPLPDVPILLGVQNDGDFLYVCLKTSDAKLKAQIARLGMTVWLNGEGKDTRGYGARFPVGPGFHRPRTSGDAPTPPPQGERSQGASVDASRVELIGPTESDRFPVARADAYPIQAALGDDVGVMVIELRFPLMATPDHPLAVEPKAGGTIALGLETERPHLQRGERGSHGEGTEPGDREGGGPPSGAPGGYGGSGPGGYGGSGRGGYGGMGPGGGHRGGMGPGMGGDRSDMATAVKLWLLVKLAVAPAAVQPAK
jgi:hypothetical protein